MCIVVSIVLVLLLAACSGPSSEPPSQPMPPSQLAFNESIQQLRDRYSQANESSNEVTEKAAEKAVVTFLKKTHQRADGWVATIDSVSSEDKEVTITAKQDSATFYLVLFQPSGVSAAASLSKGDRIEFSGDLGEEQSITTSGALREPEFRFYPESVTRQQMPIANQPRQAITKRIAAKKKEEAALSQSHSLKAEYSFDAGVMKIRNADNFTWRNCHGEINSHGLSSGYEAILGDAGPGDSLTVEPYEFADQDGERFNPITHKMQSFWLDCDTPKGRASDGREAR